MTKERVILGIDPGTNLLGFGVIRITADRKPHFEDMGVLDLRRCEDSYSKLAQIHSYVTELCRTYKPDNLAIESPFLAKNAQVIFKLGRAQGVAIAAAVASGLKVTEYAPRKAKIAICGNGAASKEQVNMMVQRTLGIEIAVKHLDASDALAIALCHFYQLANPLTSSVGTSSWEKFIEANPDRINTK